MTNKPTKRSIAFYAFDGTGAFMAVKCADDDDSLPSVWGLPAASLRPGESHEDAIRRAALAKLGIDVHVMQYVGDDTQERREHILHLSEYEVRIVMGEPRVASEDSTVSNYAAVQWAHDPELLHEAADRGSSCSRIFLKNRGLWTYGKA